MKWPLSKLYKITPPTRLHLISRDKPDSFSSRRSLLVSPLSNYHQSLRRGSAAIQRTPWHADRRSAEGWRSQTKGESRKRTEESLLSSGRFRLSPATGAGGQQCCLPVLFQQLLRLQHRFFVSFLTQKRNVPFRPPSSSKEGMDTIA